jgi:hypothetical protein
MTASTSTLHRDDAFVAAYETLRQGVLAGASCGGHVGLVLLLREGLTAWMAHRPAGPAPVEPEPRVAAPILSNEIDAAVVRVLANMALGGLEEMRA